MGMDGSSDRVWHRKGISLERLGAFLAIYEAEGIARAAPDDPVRQSQLSRQLGELERALATTLFERRGRSLVPTAAAAALARVVRDLGAGLAEAAHAPIEERAWTLGAGGSAIHWLVLPALAAQRPTPRMETLALSSEDVLEHLRDGRVDLGVLRKSALPPGVSSARIGVVRYRVFMPRTSRRAPASVHDVARALPLVSFSGEPRLSDMLARVGPSALVVETFAQAARAVQSGAYAGVLPAFAARELPPSRFHAIDAPFLQRGAAPLVLAWRSRLEDTRAGFANVRDALLEGMRSGIRASIDDAR